MYTDTKSSYDFVKEPVQAAEDPELMSLHRKLRIQKDRLVSWGLEWSDPSQSPDIDESINKAGLSELVGSVMSTIKEILAEAEPLWQSSKRSSDEKGAVHEMNLDRKTSLITWDKSRFQDLVRDLTMSIDTLYDLSRTRQSTRKPHSIKHSDSSSSLSKVHAVEERLFESNRIQTPKQINPATLIWPRDLKGVQSDNATDGNENTVTSLYKHPLDPRNTRYTHLTSDSKSLDLYSLAMLLLEIGLWTSLSDIFPSMNAIPENPTAVFKQLATRCGSLYMKAVQACWRAPEDELSQKARADVMHQKTFWKVSKALQTCCALDDAEEEVSELEDNSTPQRTSRSSTPLRRGLRESKSQAFVAPTPPVRPSWTEKSHSFTKPSPAPTFPEVINWAEKPTAASKITAPPPQQIVEKPKPKLRTYPAVRISQDHLNFWHTGLMPHINHVLRGFYRKYPESVEISLESIGESPTTTKPTILSYGLKVCRGKVLRSRSKGVRRSMAREFSGEQKPANAEHQERPGNGASIGAYIGERHLPPVSFGGLIMVDEKPYGMTVHHMLDDPEEEEEEDDVIPREPILRSSAHSGDLPDLTHSDSSVYSSGDEEFMYQLSDYESDFGSEAPTDSEFDDEDDYQDESDGEEEPGDIKGVPEGCGEGYIITQPAMDDVEEDFYPDEETRDEDHLESFSLGEVYASSGIRRRTEKGVVHEIDWALFEFNDDRCPEENNIQNGARFCQLKEGEYPTAVAPHQDLADLQVHCMARTSGLQQGRILPGMTIVKIYGRQTPSSSYQVAGKLGVPGDSGAWVVDNEHGRACGHVLAWSSRKKVAYICPMEILLKDIGETLNASSMSMPGGDELLDNESSTIVPTACAPVTELPVAISHEEELSRLLRDLRIPPSPDHIEGIDPNVYPDQPLQVTKERGDNMNFSIPIRLVSGQGVDAQGSMRRAVGYSGSSEAAIGKDVDVAKISRGRGEGKTAMV
ncbi:hypothetical protein M7I_3598 [Glarea lozoyensis 74030]|uniref:Uncharacterized protein n=1 Tax=Glarea lozoyensis (strain ATCC 74030 / MF5533) TaxID=1104152 RepID=H0ELX5_GLAL7|nr:hypothetical protein M7I_3598 [Glarea lozoyensis 74030]